MTFSIHTAKKIARGAIVVATAVALAGPAMAGNNGKGNGNGNGNGRGNSANAQNTEKGNNGRGAIASELKGLNAAHANINAMMNADPNSQVGQIYAYQQAVLGARAAGAEAEFWGEEYERLAALTPQDIIDTYGPYSQDAYNTASADAALAVSNYQDLIAGGDTSQETSDALVLAEIEAQRLAGLTDDEKAYEFTEGYSSALLEADANSLLNADAQIQQQALADAQLLEMNGGEELTEDALNEFLRLLGLLE